MPKPAIKVMPDYHCPPLWHHGGPEVGPIDPSALGLSEALAAKLKRWAATYDSHLNLNDPAGSKWTREEEARFDAEGRQLCRDLANEVGSRFAVVYSSRCIPVEAL